MAKCWPVRKSAIESDLVGLYDVFTASSSRGQGLSRRLCAHLLARAREQGARVAYLQVDAANHAARALYHRLGFADGYAYHYRALPSADALTRYSPSPSSTPRCTFMACTAAPLAPLPRLSSRAIRIAWRSLAKTKMSTRLLSLLAITSK